MRVIVRFKTDNLVGGESHTVQVMQPGDWTTVSLTTPYLVSAGQQHRLAVRVEIQAEDGEHRSLHDILADAVQHGREKPDHGGNCVCMDKYIRELKAQIRDVLPDSDREADWERRHDARWRVHYLLNAAARSL